MKVIFMGTSDFACPTLKELIDDQEIEIVAVYTKEPQKSGRGQNITNSPIHEIALQHNLKIITPKNLKDQEIQQEFIDFNADLAVVVAYGLILPVEILNGTKWGCFNIHPSLLPKWRGAAPLQRAIMNGDQQIAVTIIKMDPGLDSGDMVSIEPINLNQDTTYEQLSNQTSVIGAEILLKTIKNIANNNFTLIKQDDSKATYATKIEKLECKINWHLSAKQIKQNIQGLSGFLTAYFEHQDKKIKIYQAQIIDDDSDADFLGIKPGTIIDNNFTIQCQNGKIRPILLQMEGKKIAHIDEFLRGFRF
jgi:methionyl-tRNA formyltransferase